MQLIIAGFHRSGTSVTAQLLRAAGLFVGDRLYGASPANPYGHFEDLDVVEIHQSIMEAHGDDWQWDQPFPFRVGRRHWTAIEELVQRRNAAYPLWGFKDPRACLMLGMWKHVVPDAKVLVVYRDPGECVRSLEFRHASAYFEGRGNLERSLRFFREPDHGLRVWDVYNRAVLSYASRHESDCLVLPISQLQAGEPVVDRVNRRFGLDLADVPTTAVYDPQVTGSRTLPQRVHSPDVEARVMETWQALDALATKTGGRG